MKKNLLIFIALFSFLLILSKTSFAKEGNYGNKIRDSIKNTIEQGKEASLSPKEIKEQVRQKIREEVKERNQGLLDKVKNLVQKKLRFNARIKGKITSIGDNSIIIVEEDGKNYTVNITNETKLIRRFGGESKLTEFSVGNEVNVFGKFTDENQTTIDAKLIRNISIQKRWGVFFGEVTAKNTDNFVMKTLERGDQTVYYGSARFINLKKELINYSDVQIGNRVRVKGIWDRSLNVITEVEEIRVFSQSPTSTSIK